MKTWLIQSVSTTHPHAGVPLMVCTALLLAALSPLAAQGPPPPRTPVNLEGGPSEFHPLVEGVDYQDNRGVQLPGDVTLVNADGRSLTMDELFSGQRPIVLQFGYFGCPMLCSLVLNGLTQAIADMPWTPGQEYDVISVSIDHREDAQLARMMKQGYIERVGKPQAAAGWYFLTGEEDEIRRLADAAGFGYRYLPRRDEIAHPAVIILLTPDGRVSRYLPGILYDPQTLRLSLVEASEGKVGSWFDHLLLTCFMFDPDAGKYNWHAMALMRVAGALTVMLVAGGILSLFAFDRLHRRYRLLAANPGARPNDKDGSP